MCHVCLVVINRMSIKVKVAEVCILVKSAQKLYIKTASDAEVLLLVNGRTIKKACICSGVHPFL